MTLYVTRLGGKHNREGFCCGRQSLDDWFRYQASSADKRHGSARVYVLVDDDIDDGCHPLGYYALVGHAVCFEEAPPGLVRGYPPRQPVGAVLLARLAVDERYQHASGLSMRLGETLLADAVRSVMLGDTHVATPLLVVDALDETAARFYARYAFPPFPDRPLRLGARLKDIRKIFGLD